MDAKGLRAILDKAGFDVAHVTPYGRTKVSAGHDSRIEVSETIEGQLRVDVFGPMFSGHESQQTLFERVYAFLAKQGMEVKVGEKQVGSIKRKFILGSS